MRRIIALPLCLFISACNDHPMVPVDAVFSVARVQSVDVPERPQLDLLFVVDDSGSMAEEQASLAANFAEVARFLQADLGGRADVRVAVTTTDLARAERRGAFVQPTRPGCEGMAPVLALGPGTASAADTVESIAAQLACLTDVGVRGANREKGLEAMRWALDCNGPNAAAFGRCCVADGDGRAVYDRQCLDTPEFLRPDALLAVVFLTDEDDCSDPAAHPAASRRGLCRTGVPEAGDCEPGEAAAACRARVCDVEKQPIFAICRHGAGGLDAEGIPAAYADPRYCPTGDRAACFAVECGGRDAESCHGARCGPNSDADNASLHTCAWFADLLTPVDDYRDFLAGLKREPARQLVVAAFTGVPRTTEAGNAVRAVLPVEAPDPACVGAAGSAQPSEACCPGGACAGEPMPACTSGLGSAAAGHRYFALAEAFGERGIGCTDDGTCVSLCEGDLTGAVSALTSAVGDALRCLCLDVPPRGDTVSVELRCPQGGCAPTRLSPEQYTVESGRAECTSGAAVCLDQPPPPRAHLEVTYGVDVPDTVTQ
jgi:hypothetical protein